MTQLPYSSYHGQVKQLDKELKTEHVLCVRVSGGGVGRIVVRLAVDVGHA